MQKYLECGQIMRAHGIRGAMVIDHYCDTAEVFCSLKNLYFRHGDEYVAKKILHAVPYKTNVLVTIEGITTPEEVVKIRLSYVYADRDELKRDKGDYFIADLIGLDVIDKNTGEKYGVLSDVINRGSQDLYVVKREDKPEAYIPAVAEFIAEIDLEKGIFVTPIEGMFE